MILNEVQRRVLALYECGEFQHLIEGDPSQEEFDRRLEECGDTLLIFLIREMGDLDHDDPEILWEEANNRVEGAMSQLEDVLFGMRVDYVEVTHGN